MAQRITAQVAGNASQITFTSPPQPAAKAPADTAPLTKPLHKGAIDTRSFVARIQQHSAQPIITSTITRLLNICLQPSGQTRTRRTSTS